MAKIKQVLVVNMDAKMPIGQIGAMCAHAAVKVWFDRMFPHFDQKLGCGYMMNAESGLTGEMTSWKENSFVKVVLAGDNAVELLKLTKQANKVGIPFSIIEDQIRGEKAITCIAIGPGNGDDIDKITGHLSTNLEEWKNE